MMKKRLSALRYFQLQVFSAKEVEHACNSSHLGGRARRISIQCQSKVSESLSQKQNINKRPWENGSSGKSAYRASMRPCIQSPVLLRKKKRERRYLSTYNRSIWMQPHY
jgi:hypothetical protein